MRRSLARSLYVLFAALIVVGLTACGGSSGGSSSSSSSSGGGGKTKVGFIYRRPEGRLRLQPGRVPGRAGRQEDGQRRDDHGRKRPGERRGRARHGADDRPGREDHLPDQLRSPRPGDEGRGEAPRRRRSSTQGGLKSSANVGTFFGTMWQTEYLAGMAAGSATKTEQARLRLRLPDLADAAQHQRLPARRQVGEPERDDHGRLHGQLVRPGQERRGRPRACRARAST